MLQVVDYKSNTGLISGDLSAIFPLLESSFGKNLARLRTAAGFKTKAAFAAELGIDPPVVSRWENGKTGLPETPTLLRLAKRLSCAIDDLLRGVDAEYDAIVERRYGPQGTAHVIASIEANDILLKLDERGELEFATSVLRRMLRGAPASKAKTPRRTQHSDARSVRRSR